MTHTPRSCGLHGSLLFRLCSPLLFLNLAPALAQDPPPRRLVPELAAQAETEARIKEVFRAEYARRKPADLQTLALILLQQGLETKDDDTARFVLLREARELAARAGEVRTALQASEEMARGYNLDGLTLKTETLAKVALGASTPTARRALAESALTLVEEALGGDDFETAHRLLGLAEESARKARDSALSAQMAACAKAVGASQKEYDRAKEANARLRGRPDDRDANLVSGKYYCLTKGDWDKGLPFLALGGDRALQALARRDRDRPTDAAERVRLADAWWEAAQEEVGPAQGQLRRRAGYWYRLALPDLTGFTRTRVAKQLQLAEQAPGLLPWEPVGPLRCFEGHRAEVWTVAFSADGRYAVSGSEDKTVRLWDVATGRELRRFLGHTDVVRSVAFGRDGRSVLSGSDDSTLILWDLVTGRLVRSFVGHVRGVTAVDLAPDGHLAVSGGGDGTIRLWEVASGRELRRLAGHKARVSGVAISPDGRRLLSGSWDGTVRLWDLSGGKELRRFLGHGDKVESVAFVAEGRRALSGGADKTLRLWELSSGRELGRFLGHTDRVRSVAISPDGRRALSGGWDRTLRLWDVAKGCEVRCFQVDAKPVLGVAFSPDGHRALSCSADKTVCLWGLPR